MTFVKTIELMGILRQVYQVSRSEANEIIKQEKETFRSNALHGTIDDNMTVTLLDSGNILVERENIMYLKRWTNL